jgi:hypothetical protein
MAWRLSSGHGSEELVIQNLITKKPTEQRLLWKLKFRRPSYWLAYSIACLNPIVKDASYPTSPFSFQGQNKNGGSPVCTPADESFSS